MRLIDADALPSVKFHALPYTHITPSDVNAESYKRGWNDAIDAIVDCAPTIDAVPVVHGKWIQTNIYHLRHGDGLVSEAYCSVCEMYSYQLSAFPYVGYNYCPRCGAKMDGGDGDG